MNITKGSVTRNYTVNQKYYNTTIFNRTPATPYRLSYRISKVIRRTRTLIESHKGPILTRVVTRLLYQTLLTTHLSDTNVYAYNSVRTNYLHLLTFLIPISAVQFTSKNCICDCQPSPLSKCTIFLPTSLPISIS